MPTFEKHSHAYAERMALLKRRIAILRAEEEFLDFRIGQTIAQINELVAMPEPESDVKSIAQMMRM